MGSGDDLDAFAKNLDKVYLGIKIAFFSSVVIGAILLSPWIYLRVHGYDPQYGQKAEMDRLKTVLESDARPAVVFFYTKKNSKEARALLPVMDEFAKRHTGLAFYYCQLKMQCQLAKEYQGYNGVMVFEHGKEIRRSSHYFQTQDENKGMVTLLLKDYLKPKWADMPARGGIRKFTETSFELSQSSTRPLFVNFSSALCGACRAFKPFYEAIAKKYSGVADFFYLERESANELPLFRQYKAHSFPTVVLIQDEKERARFTGAYSDLQANEERILGAMLPYLENGDEKP